MKRLHKYWLEAAFVVGVLCIILSISLPAFFHNQQAETNAMIFDGMAQILNAIQQYQNEHQQYPAAVSEGKQKSIWNEEGIILFNNLNYDYLHSFLSYAKPDGLEMTNEFKDLQYSQSFSLDVISVYFNSKDKSVVIGIVANRFNEPPSQKMIVDHWVISKEESIMKPNFFFAPSNGLASRGSLYLDIFGNHSPWIHKPKTDLIASELKQLFSQPGSHE